MSKLPQVSGRETVRALEKAGFRFLRQKGSHIHLRRDEPFVQVSVPNHQSLKRGTLKSILNASGLSVDEFIDLL
jgi:predicted RNA binding protein YcfA (HicA-like mRNA interferase family)